MTSRSPRVTEGTGPPDDPSARRRIWLTGESELRRIGLATSCSPKTLRQRPHLAQSSGGVTGWLIRHFRLLGDHYRSGDRPDTAKSFAGDERRHRGKKQEHE